jgi:hypothetical protein
VSGNDLGACRASRDIDTPLLNSSHDRFAGFVDAGFAQLNRFEELQISGRLMMQACPFVEIMSSWQTIYHHPPVVHWAVTPLSDSINIITKSK